MSWIAALFVLGLVGTGLFGGRLALDLFVRRMMRPPLRPPVSLPPDMQRRALGVEIEGAADRFHAWLLEPDRAAKGAVVLVHGWGRDAGSMSPLAPSLLERDLACLLVDLPGHGLSGPVSHYHAPRMLDDMLRVRRWLESRPRFAGLPAAVVGFSFGGLGALLSASRDACWRAVAALAAPVGPMEATEIYLRSRYLPASLLRKPIRATISRLLKVDPNAYTAERNLPRVRVPVLLLHGARDPLVPVAHMAGLRAALPPALVTTVRLEEDDHVSILVNPEVHRCLASFLSRHLVV